MSLPIQTIPSHRIDQKKWNNCIAQSSNGFIYATTLYLNNITDHWDGLVIDDYTAVIPLPWRKKYGIKYLYTPPFIQQLGLIGKWNETTVSAVMQHVQAFASFGDYQFNYSNQFIKETTTHHNYILDLSVGYEAITKKYKTDLLQNLKKATATNLVYATDSSAAAAIAYYQKHYAHRTAHVGNNDYQNFLQLCLALQKNNQCIVRKATNTNGKILAIALLLKDERRIYNMLNTTTDEGRKTEANHFLMDQIIREFAGNTILFDFEGSDIDGVRNFYEKFGAIDQPYFHWHHNQLPFPLNLFKR